MIENFCSSLALPWVCTIGKVALVVIGVPAAVLIVILLIVWLIRSWYRARDL